MNLSLAIIKELVQEDEATGMEVDNEIITLFYPTETFNYNFYKFKKVEVPLPVLLSKMKYDAFLHDYSIVSAYCLPNDEGHIAKAKIKYIEESSTSPAETGYFYGDSEFEAVYKAYEEFYKIEKLK